MILETQLHSGKQTLYGEYWTMMLWLDMQSGLHSAVDKGLW